MIPVFIFPLRIYLLYSKYLTTNNNIGEITDDDEEVQFIDSPILLKMSLYNSLQTEPGKAFKDSLNRSDKELRDFHLSHKFLVFGESA